MRTASSNEVTSGTVSARGGGVSFIRLCDATSHRLPETRAKGAFEKSASLLAATLRHYLGDLGSRSNHDL